MRNAKLHLLPTETASNLPSPHQRIDPIANQYSKSSMTAEKGIPKRPNKSQRSFLYPLWENETIR